MGTKECFRLLARESAEPSLGTASSELLRSTFGLL